MDAGLQAGVNEAIRKLYKVEPYVRRYVKQDLGEASKLIVAAVKGRTPVGTKAHGKYRPGNLKRSIRKLPLRRAKSAVLVGPLSRGGAVDGYYARFLEFGTKHITAVRFIERAEQASGAIAQRFALKLLQRRIESYKRQNKA